jgi:hypothetical protein
MSNKSPHIPGTWEKKLSAYDKTRDQGKFTVSVSSDLHNILYVTVGHRFWLCEKLPRTCMKDIDVNREGM